MRRIRYAWSSFNVLRKPLQGPPSKSCWLRVPQKVRVP